MRRMAGGVRGSAKASFPLPSSPSLWALAKRRSGPENIEVRVSALSVMRHALTGRPLGIVVPFGGKGPLLSPPGDAGSGHREDVIGRLVWVWDQLRVLR